MKIRFNRVIWAAAIALITAGTVLTVSAQDATAPTSPPASTVPPTASSSFSEEEKIDPQSGATEQQAQTARLGTKEGEGCIANAAAIEDLRLRREEIEAKQKELTTKEAELKAREKALEDQIKSLEQIRDDIAKTDAARKKENEEKVTKLVETFETMSPKAAAQLLSNVEESLAVAAIARISTQRLAKIMNVMEPGRSSRLAEILAGVVRARNTLSRDKAEATASSTKGGEKNDGQNIKQQQRNTTPNPAQREPGSVRKDGSSGGSEKGKAGS